MTQEGIRSIAPNCLEQVRLRTPQWNTKEYLAASTVCQVLPHCFEVCWQIRHQNLPGHSGGGVGVDIDQNPLDEFGRIEILDFVDEKGGSPDDPPGSNVEDLDGGFQLILGQAQDIEVLRLVQLHLPDSVCGPDRLEFVPQRARALEVEGGRGFLHGRSDVPLERPGVAAQEGGQIGHHSVVIVVGHRPHARSRTALDVEEQAGAAQSLVAPELGI